MQLPVEAAHVVQPNEHASHDPESLRKNPSAHAAQSVPLEAVVQPALHVQPPPEEHSPLRQLHEEGGLETVGTRQTPLPVSPSEHVVQLDGHGEQVGPKKPGEHDEQVGSVNPVEQTHELLFPDEDGVQTPPEEHAGVHDADCMSTTDN